MPHIPLTSRTGIVLEESTKGPTAEVPVSDKRVGSYRVERRHIPRGTRVSDGAIEITDTEDALEITDVGRKLILRPGRIQFGVDTFMADGVGERRRGRITVRLDERACSGRRGCDRKLAEIADRP